LELSLVVNGKEKEVRSENTNNWSLQQKIRIKCGEKKKYEYSHAPAKNSYRFWQKEADQKVTPPQFIL